MNFPSRLFFKLLQERLPCSVVRCGFNKDKMMNLMYVGALFITSDLQCVPIILARTTGLTFIRQGFWDTLTYLESARKSGQVDASEDEASLEDLARRVCFLIVRYSVFKNDCSIRYKICPPRSSERDLREIVSEHSVY